MISKDELRAIAREIVLRHMRARQTARPSTGPEGCRIIPFPGRPPAWWRIRFDGAGFRAGQVLAMHRTPANVDSAV